MPLGAHEYLTSPESADLKRIKRHEWKLQMANWLRDEINEVLSRYDIPSSVYDADVQIDALCVIAVDKIEAALNKEKADE